MRIHHLLDNLNIGGAEMLVVALSRLLQDSGHQVVVHGVFGGGPLSETLAGCGIPVVIHPPVQKLVAIVNLWKYFRRERPDAVHCHNAGPTVFGAPAARLAGVRRIVSTRHGSSSHTARRERKFWYAARFCDRVVAVSNAAHGEFLKDRWTIPEKLVTILNGARTPQITPEPGTRVRKTGFVLVSVGRFVKEKDFPGLLRAVELARRTVPDLTLWIAGDGDLRPQLEALIAELSLQDSVRLLGMRSDVGYWLSLADVFVMSSVFEGLPVALLEAMALGRPAIVTEVGGMPDVVRAAGSGLVVPPSNPEALANAIIDLANRRNDLPALGAAARECYNRRFTLESMAERYLELYRHGCVAGSDALSARKSPGPGCTGN